jgi:hypothetical protein
MAKKSTATRQTPAARRSQTTARTTAKAADVMLVRGANATRPTAPVPANTKPVAAARPAGVGQQERPRALEAPRAARPTAPRKEPAAQPTPKAQASRVARARVTQRARTANLITPEHYSYVINDLKLIAGLVISMFLVIIVLAIILHTRA